MLHQCVTKKGLVALHKPGSSLMECHLIRPFGLSHLQVFRKFKSHRAINSYIEADGLTTIQNEGKRRGYLTTLDGEFVVSSSSLGLESRSWILHRVRQGQVALENAKFRGKFLVTGSSGGMSRTVFLSANPQHWHLTCRANKLI